LGTLPHGAPSQVKLTCCPWHGSSALTVKVKDAVTPVLAEPLLGVMLKLCGSSACATIEVPAAIARAAAAATSHLVA
jgi:hypothetical protein